MSLEQEENALISRYNQLVSNASVHHYDELFAHPLHPYTRSLLSAIPLPDPHYEKQRKRMVYVPREAHDYSQEQPTLREVAPGHFVSCNTPEFEQYCGKLAQA